MGVLLHVEDMLAELRRFDALVRRVHAHMPLVLRRIRTRVRLEPALLLVVELALEPVSQNEQVAGERVGFRGGLGCG